MQENASLHNPCYTILPHHIKTIHRCLYSCLEVASYIGQLSESGFKIHNLLLYVVTCMKTYN